MCKKYFCFSNPSKDILECPLKCPWGERDKEGLCWSLVTTVAILCSFSGNLCNFLTKYQIQDFNSVVTL